MTEPLHFVAEIVKVQTTKDMGIRVTLDLPESLTDVAMQLMEAKRRGAILEIAAIPVEQVINPEESKNAEISKRSVWQP
jgi:hypothetical protein